MVAFRVSRLVDEIEQLHAVIAQLRATLEQIAAGPDEEARELARRALAHLR